MTDQEMNQMLSGKFDLDVANFTKWNPDETYKWIKLDIHFFKDPRIEELSSAEKELFLRVVLLRAVTNAKIDSVTTAWIQRHAGVARQSVHRGLVKLLKSGLLSCNISPKNRIDKNREEKPPKTTPPTNLISPEKKSEVAELRCVIDELKGIEDALFLDMSVSAQQSWLREFGIDLIRANVPTFYAAWRELSKTSIPKPKMLFISNCLKQEKKGISTATQQKAAQDWTGFH